MKKIGFIVGMFSFFMLAGCGSSSSVPAQVVATTTGTTMVTYTMEEVKTHDTDKSCRAVVRTKVYDFTSRASQHPGGSGKILAICGKDATKTFTKVHGGKEKPEMKLGDFYIGDIK